MSCEERINEYLGSGGLFNPELMEHRKVRDLVTDCLYALSDRKLEILRLRHERYLWKRRAEQAEAAILCEVKEVLKP